MTSERICSSYVANKCDLGNICKISTRSKSVSMEQDSFKR